MNSESVQFLKDLETHGLVPSKIEVAEWQNWLLVSSYDQVSSSFISESVSMGIDKDPEVALLKSLTEYCERRLSRESSDPIVRLTERSDGFAAFPCFNNKAQLRARENAFNEACERYLWAKWWDCSQVKFHLSNAFHGEQATDINALTAEFRIKSIREIRVGEATKAVELCILLAETESGGFVTGGAASNLEDYHSRFDRAFGELLRHLVVLKNMGPRPSLHSFYERRLFEFGAGKWSSLVSDRLSRMGEETIVLPELIADKNVDHRAMNVVSIHRCLFKNQPEFVGGRLERLCI